MVPPYLFLMFLVIASVCGPLTWAFYELCIKVTSRKSGIASVLFAQALRSLRSMFSTLALLFSLVLTFYAGQGDLVYVGLILAGVNFTLLVFDYRFLKFWGFTWKMMLDGYRAQRQGAKAN